MDKQNILDEIKRTAVANGDMPLGLRRFAKATGINEYDLLKHWPRWSDAQREAGFIANQRNPAYGRDVILGRLIELVRELGRFPTAREVKFKGRNDSTFPNEKAIRRQLEGGMDHWALKLAEYCGQSRQLSDVAEACA